MFVWFFPRLIQLFERFGVKNLVWHFFYVSIGTVMLVSHRKRVHYLHTSGVLAWHRINKILVADRGKAYGPYVVRQACQ